MKVSLFFELRGNGCSSPTEIVARGRIQKPPAPLGYYVLTTVRVAGPSVNDEQLLEQPPVGGTTAVEGNCLARYNTQPV